MKLSLIIEDIISGDWGSDKKTIESPCPVHCIRSADIVPYYNGTYEGIPVRYLSSRSYHSRKLKEGDVIIEKSGGTNDCSTGRPMYVSKELLTINPELVCSNFCSVIRIKKSWNSKFVYYFLRLVHSSGVFHNFEGKTSGIHNLQMEAAFDAIELPNITLQEQNNIVNLLSNIEGKIYINNQQNSILEQMAKQLYDYWFVQFDFPDENGRPYKSSGGKMVWNEKLKREIPEGWVVKPFAEATDLLYGYPFNTKLFTLDAKNKPIIRIRDILDNSISAYTTEDVDEKYKLAKGDVIVGMDGNFHMNFWCDDVTYINQRCFRVRPKLNSKLSSVYIYHYIQPYIKIVEQRSAGSTVGHLLDSDIQRIFIPIPNKDIFGRTMDSVLKAIINNRSQNKSLQLLRNSLLPLLMSGQVTIKD